jgi:hypothetical protein
MNAVEEATNTGAAATGGAEGGDGGGDFHAAVHVPLDAESSTR